MQRIDGRLVFSASDLNGFLECAALTQLEREATERLRVRPEPDETAQLLARKGDEHERRYLEILRSRGLEVREIPAGDRHDAQGLYEAEHATLAAMERGAEIIYQATFFDGTFMGHADFLRRVDTPSARWPWSYEVLDTKLALATKTYFLVQLCNYSEHVERLQGSMPRRIVVVPGSNVEAPYELASYLAYYRHLKAGFLAHVNGGRTGAYPHEVSHCRVCRWNPVCDARRDADDYLGLVALMRRDDIRRLGNASITTIAQLATAGEERRPNGMTPETFERLCDQARLQHGQRTTGVLTYELLPAQPSRGFALLPPPDVGDVFFDMEGDPLYTPQRGLEYLFGVYFAKESRYVAYWAKSGRDERPAFEALVDLLARRRDEYPGMHVYHYAPYETAALKRLAGFYATREEELDTLLRAQSFVDLYAVVRQGLRISQPSYSIKKLEPFYGFARETKTQRGDDSILMFESWLIDGDDNILVDIENYNRDDCISTLRLRDWLLARRAELIERDGDLPWKPAPEPRAETAQDASDERAQLRDALLAGLDAPQSAIALRDADERFRARWLLGHLLDYHRRDDKPAWWAYFYRCENRDELVEFDRKAIGGLRHRSDVPSYRQTPRQNPVYVFAFPDQLHGFQAGDGAYVLDAARPHEAGTIVAVDDDVLEIHVKLRGGVEPADLDALAPVPAIPSETIRAALQRVAESYLDGTLEVRHRALADVLLRRLPRLRGGTLGQSLQPEVPDAESIAEIAQRLDESYLFVQGPPGSGKSTTGAGVVLDLLRAGKRVAILANSHKVIHNLLHKIEEQAVRRGQSFRGIQRCSNTTEGSRFESKLAKSFVTPSFAADALSEPHDLAAGTAWALSREELAGAYDYLVIDEAGQVSLANAIACAPCAHNVILLGDPLQLAQVSQGAHPLGVELSVLAHLLGDDTTVLPERGVFLDHSHRMHPQICAFISESVYAGRLQASEATYANRVESQGLTGSGLRYLAVEHEGNRRESREEADAVVGQITRLLDGTVTVATPDDPTPKPRAFTPRDVLVVSPYNAQRRLIAQRLTDAGLRGVAVGTVDKFQGQEAPVVFYSMATSSGDDIPRDIGFLFEKNRFNVAISRAQCMSVLVCSPRLLDTRCSTPEQMALVNLLCRYAEVASAIS
ncbi:MAG: TM0106 family RecB-like putative nuclease [Candidatus Tyrphobacter sp.]